MRGFLIHVDKVVALSFGVIIIGVPLLLNPAPHETWKSTVLSSVLVLILYGVFVRQFRKWEREVRQATIREMGQMLRDVLNNKLSVIMINASLTRPLSEEDAKRLESVRETVQKISEDLDTLSVDALEVWRRRYQGFLHTSRDI